MRIVELTQDAVPLFKVLKFEGLVNSGSDAKLLIDEGRVSVNGQVETQRRKKIRDGDVIELGDEALQVTLAP
ncbi:MAG: RNA-binding S4 domain-containing protein [Gammaproteobacteria bacterium]|jgi:ribosome-associated protein|nr:RNA-binding S4 domain-containing protein [Gammaproteobacteria bacterium]MBT5052400.1 RNA-binding S4 domain-containing protein [Gammaproteobacteria bacterium]MDC0464241.1 RNA-binding S4 domain-containing protein [Pseudomonadales bacterium]